MGGPSGQAQATEQGLTISAPVQFPRPVVDAFSGAVAGGLARVAIAPLDVIKIRFQVCRYPSMQDTCWAMFCGVTGIWILSKCWRKML